PARRVLSEAGAPASGGCHRLDRPGLQATAGRRACDEGGMTEIELKSPEEIEKMRRASRIVAEVLEALRHQIKPGVATEELDRFAEKFILDRGGKPAFKGYQVRDKVYQHTLCVSVNEEVVHGIPSRRVLKEGDIVGLDRSEERRVGKGVICRCGRDLWDGMVA